jgi:prophage regulatory protein
MASNAAMDNGAPGARGEAGTSIGHRILRLPQVCSMTGLGRSMIYQMEAEGRFPRRVPIGARAVGWVEGEIQDWLRGRIESRCARPGTSVSRG